MKPDSVYLSHIRDEINYLMDTFQNMTFAEFINNRTLKLSAQKSLEIIGEASKNISDELKLKYSDIPWNLMVGLRNRLTHKYFDVSWTIVWEIIEDNIPELERGINMIISSEKYL